MSSVRKSYTVEFKKKCVIESFGKKIIPFCKEKNLDVRMFMRWRAKYEHLNILSEYGNGLKRRCGSGRKPLYPELENLLYDWIIDRRSMSFVVRRANIQEMSLKLATELEISPEQFKASDCWLSNFLQRHHLSLRRPTTLFKLEDEEIIKRALTYKSFIDKIDFSQYQSSHVVAMDETAVFMGDASQSTVEMTGCSSIYIPSTGYESTRITCILAIRLDGTKVTPLLISKGKKNKIQKVSGIYVIETSKAWATQDVIRKWICLVLPRLQRGNEKGLIVWDSASTHRAKEMKKFVAQQRINQVMIPAGMTGYLQSLDIVINKPFKDNVRVRVNDYVENRMVRNERGNLTKPSLEEVVSWVNYAWNKISSDTVSKALRASYLDKKYSFEESAIAKHERLGPLILEKLRSADNQSYEINTDVLEEDDIDAILE